MKTARPVAVTWNNKCWKLVGVYGFSNGTGCHVGEEIAGIHSAYIYNKDIKLFARDIRTSMHARPVQMKIEFL